MSLLPRGLTKAQARERRMTPNLEQRIERALLVLAYVIEKHGDAYIPTYERFETELANLRSKSDVRQRARQRLHAFMNFSPPQKKAAR